MNEKSSTVAALRQALPYLRLFQGKYFVIKCGGDLFDRPNGLRRLLEQVGVLHRLGIRVVVVHGGGPQTTRLSQDLGRSTEMVNGRRVTSPETLVDSTMVLNGQLNASAVALLRELGIRAVGLSGLDGDMIVASKRPVVEVDGESVDFGEVGDVRKVDVGLVERLVEDGYLPVISPLSASEQGRILNVNADVAAAELACALGAEKLIALTNVPGILTDANDPDSLVSYVDLDGLDRLVEEGVIQGGMAPKVAALKRAVAGGVVRAHVISYETPDSLLTEIFTNEGSGTMVVERLGAASAKETAAIA